MKKLENKRLIITGGTSGIGRAIAIECAKEGAHVAICGTQEAKAEEVLQSMKENQASSHQDLSYFLLDVSKEEEVKMQFSSLIERWGNIDSLIHSAGIVRDGLFMKMKTANWQEVLDVNLHSAFYCAQAVVMPMLRHRQGSILFISSVVGLMGGAGQANYAASKAGLHGLTKSLAKELASRNIRVNCIAPGFIQTPMTDQLLEEQKQAILQQIPMKRYGKAEEVAKLASFLISEEASYVTGQVWAIDGGITM